MILESDAHGIFITHVIKKRSFMERLKFLFYATPPETIYIGNEECKKLLMFLEYKLYPDTLEMEVTEDDNPYR